MQKTTVYLDDAEYRRLKQTAHRKGQAPAAVIRQAIAEYNFRHKKRPWPKSIGAYHSGIPDLAQRDEYYLGAFGFGEDGLSVTKSEKVSDRDRRRHQRRRGVA